MDIERTKQELKAVAETGNVIDRLVVLERIVGELVALIAVRQDAKGRS